MNPGHGFGRFSGGEKSLAKEIEARRFAALREHLLIAVGL
jgi:hypothetical protein